MLGAGVVFLCEVDVDAMYSIEWTFYGTALPSNAWVKHENELVIENITHSNFGIYVCYAISNEMKITAESYLSVIG